MPPLEGELKSRILAALREHYVEEVVILLEPPRSWIRENLPSLTDKGFKQALWEFADAGGRIDQHEEKRENWQDWEFYYDMVLEIEGVEVYVEMRFPDWEEDPSLYVVSVHAPSF